MGFLKSSAKREVHINTSLQQQIRKTSNKQPNFTCKATRKRRTPKLVKERDPKYQNRKKLKNK